MRPLPEVPPGIDVAEGIRRYELVCLVALAVLALGLLQQGLGGLVMFPIVIGLVGLVRKTGIIPWKAAPGMLVLTLAIFLTTQPYFAGRFSLHRSDELADLLLCVAVLAYVVGHFRLQSLAETPLPSDPRRGRALPGPSTRPIPEHEIPILLISLPIWGAAALFAWSRVPDRWDDLEVPPPVCQMLVVLWALGLVLLVAAAVLSHLARRRLRPEEAALFLQDMLWKETRGEQRRMQRRLAWARLRLQRRKARAERVLAAEETKVPGKG